MTHGFRAPGAVVGPGPERSADGPAEHDGDGPGGLRPGARAPTRRRRRPRPACWVCWRRRRCRWLTPGRRRRVGGSRARRWRRSDGYAAVTAGFWCLPASGTAGCASLLGRRGSSAACQLAGRVRVVVRVGDEPGQSLSARRPFACRTAVPAGYFLTIRLLRRRRRGGGVAGRFITFPGGSLAVLVTTHLEAGPGDRLPVGQGDADRRPGDARLPDGLPVRLPEAGTRLGDRRRVRGRACRPWPWPRVVTGRRPGARTPPLPGRPRDDAFTAAHAVARTSLGRPRRGERVGRTWWTFQIGSRPRPGRRVSRPGSRP